MATRFYFRNEGPSYTPGAQAGAWDRVSANLARRMRPAKASASSNVVQDAETSTSATFDILALTMVSDELRAQTISGTLDYVLQVCEQNAAMNAHIHLHLWVTQGDSDSVRGTLLSDWIEPVEAEFASTGTTVAAAPSTGPIALTPVTCQDGDRLVLEVGVQAQNTSATSFTFQARYGGSGSDATAGDTSTSDPAWVEISTNLIFKRTYLFVNNAANPVNPGSFQGTWDATGSAVKKKLGLDKSSGGAIANTAIAETVATNPWNVLAQQFVSDQIAATTFDGAYELVLGVRESSASADAFLKVYAWVMAPDGSNRGAFIDVVSVTENTATAGQEGRRISGTMSTVVAQDGDRIVMEVGSQYTNTVTTSFTSTQYYGGSDSSPVDLSSGGTQTAGNAGGYLAVANRVVLAGQRARVLFI